VESRSGGVVVSHLRGTGTMCQKWRCTLLATGYVR